MIFLLCIWAALVFAIPDSIYHVQGIENIFPVLAGLMLIISIFGISITAYIDHYNPAALKKIVEENALKNNLKLRILKNKFYGFNYLVFSVICFYYAWYFSGISFVVASLMFVYSHYVLYSKD